MSAAQVQKLEALLARVQSRRLEPGLRLVDAAPADDLHVADSSEPDDLDVGLTARAPVAPVAAVPLLTLWKAPQRMIYALAFNGHAMLDRLWLFQNTWYWPFRGWQFHVWQKRGSEQEAIGLAYWYAFTRRPELWGWELGGMIAGLRFLWRNRLWERERLWHLVRTGRLKR